MINRQRLEFACAGFLSEMRKQFVRRNGDKPCPIRNFADYSDADRSALMASIEKAISLSGEENDLLYSAWLERRAQGATDT